MKEGKFEL